MTDETIRNIPETEGGQMAESIQPESDLAGKSRRAALAALAKHAAYTAPAVLAILSLTTKRAAAFSF
ncbi:MAG: hypothetical protein ACREC0_06690 [Methylocella sp.]